MRSLLTRLGCLLGVALLPAGTASAEVRDPAHLFSKDAVVKADEQIAEIRRSQHRQIVIQTTAELPSQYRQKTHGLIPSLPYMIGYAQDLVASADPPIDGLFVLIYQDASNHNELHVAAVLHPEEAHRDALTARNRLDLAGKFRETARHTRSVNQADLDKALLELLAQARADMIENNPLPVPQPAGGWVGIGWLLGGGLLLLVFLLLLGAYLRNRHPNPKDPDTGLPASPEAAPALLGNMLGGQATHWVTDPAFRPGDSTASKEPPPAQTPG
jgi:hypothetical protein